VDKAYRTVRDGIIAGRYAPSSRITELEVAEAAGVSRTPVREALRRLHAEGLVDFTPNQGAMVTNWSMADVDEIFELRALLEGYGAARAARLATPEQIAELQRLAEQQYSETQAREAGYLERIGQLNSAFHRRLQEASSSARLGRALSALLETALIMKTLQNYTAEDLLRSAAHHLELVRAIAARDPEWASSVMRAHLLAARRTLKR
jgi:DNA-binding GntR family transcriptional regulator